MAGAVQSTVAVGAEHARLPLFTAIVVIRAAVAAAGWSTIKHGWNKIFWRPFEVTL